MEGAGMWVDPAGPGLESTPTQGITILNPPGYVRTVLLDMRFGSLDTRFRGKRRSPLILKRNSSQVTFYRTDHDDRGYDSPGISTQWDTGYESKCVNKPRDKKPPP